MPTPGREGGRSVDSVTSDAIIYGLGGPLFGASPGPLLGAFHHRPSINEKVIRELMVRGYLDRHENVLIVGNSGTGKTHLTSALGLAAPARLIHQVHILEANGPSYRLREPKRRLQRTESRASEMEPADPEEPALEDRSKH